VVSGYWLWRREWRWKDAEILMLRHELAVAERERPSAAAVCEGGGMSRRLRRMPSRSWCVRADRHSSTLLAGSFLAEFGKECGAPFLEGGELGAELSELAVDAGQFGPCLLLADVPISVQGSGEVVDLATQQRSHGFPCTAAGRYWSLPASIAS
jgi:hypothetical protein